MRARLLIVERDLRYGEWLRHHLSVLCPDATVTLIEMSELLLRFDSLTHRDYDLLILSAAFGATDDPEPAEGLDLLRQMRRRTDFPAAIVIADSGDELTAVRALRLGVLDYLPKRLLTPQRLNATVRSALRRIERRVARSLARLAHANRTRSSASGAEGSGALPRSGAALRDLIPQYRILKTIGESEQAVVYLATSLALKRDVALKVSTTVTNGVSEPQVLARERAALAAIRPPGDRRDPRLRLARRARIFGDGLFFARRSEGTAAPRGLGRGRAALRGRNRRGAARRARCGHRAPRSETGQRHAARERRDRAHRLRSRPPIGRRLEEHAHRSAARLALLHEPRTGMGEELDARSDLYSLGVIYYELLTGKRPYAGQTAIELLEQHVNAPVPQLPESLAHHEKLITRMLAKDRAARTADAHEVMQAIAAARATGMLHSSAA
jgi:DNA-binding NarL/FixJ family response regulator